MNDSQIITQNPACSSLNAKGFEIYKASRFSKLALHLKLRDFLRHLVNSHGTDGDLFPTEETISKRLGVAKGTALKAINAMIDEGILSTKIGEGYLVRKPSCGFHDIQIILPDWNSSFLADLLEDILTECKQRGAKARVLRTLQKTVPLDQIEGKPPRTRIVLLGFTQNFATPLCRYFTKCGYDVVNVDTPVLGCGNAFVGVDNVDGIRRGMAHLMGFGHRRILLLVNEPIAETNIFDRVKEFKKIIEETGLKESRIEICPRGTWHGSAAKNALIKIMNSIPPPTAIFHVSDNGARVTLGCLAEMGIAVPRDVSVLGVDNVRASAYFKPALSTVAQPMELIAKHTVDFSLQVSKPTAKTRLPTFLIVRESTGPARR